ncbi:potassium channel family protein [Amnibacterium kyonggiense]|uniref:Trk system potassium uptake protein TrkA n=1 Tax=Amnibacterium kyonggiense TaxID=595671 RepID=A0A4R7FPC9_9MICO|nr:TrkA family potassium uptake protein [Amnibacterium kyonggiense]TDS79553.1 trk system potassium uptake protein TrkA [Amnibacterium kyonggiense]
MVRLRGLGTGERLAAEADSVAVIGLGRFGSALALELMASDTDVLGIDTSEELVQGMNGRLTHVVRADSTQEETLRELSIPDFERVVVAIGSDLEASILTASLLLEFGVPQVWAKAVSDQHGAILRRLGVHNVVYPEKDMGRRIAHRVRGNLQDFVELGDDFAAVRTRPPADLVGRTVAEARTRDSRGVTITAIKRPDGGWHHCTTDSVIGPDDLLLVTGPTRKAERFASGR